MFPWFIMPQFVHLLNGERCVSVIYSENYMHFRFISSSIEFFLSNFTPLSQSNWHLSSHLLNCIMSKTLDILLSWKCQAITFLLGIFLSNKHRISKDKQSRHFSRLNLLPAQNSLSKYKHINIKYKALFIVCAYI